MDATENKSVTVFNKDQSGICSQILKITNKFSIANLHILKCGALNINHFNLNKFQNLINLDICDNVIGYLRNGVISNLTHLKTVNFSYNCISKIDNYLFTENYNLTSINLRRNTLTEINDTIILNLEHLETFDVSYNRIAQLQDTFLDNDNLRRLKLGNNSISAISDFAFAKLPNLKILQLNDNKITEINSLVFSKLPMLICLQLNDNCISHVSMNAFTLMTKLKVLQLRDNCIKVIDNNFLKNIDLESLDLGHNIITSIKNGVFQCNPKLKFLSLGIFHHFDVSAISTLEHLVTFELLYESDKKFAISIELIILLLRIKSLICLRIIYKHGRHLDSIRPFIALNDLHTLHLECLNGDKHFEHINIATKFNSFSKLKILILKNLNLTCDPLQDDANVKIMETLTHLDLTGIQNTHIERLFTYFTSLKHLNLSYGQFTSICPDAFKHLTNLECLYLEYSKFEHICSTLFRYNCSLKVIGLSHGSIKSIDDYAFRTLASLELLDLTGNILSDISLVAYEDMNEDAIIYITTPTGKTVQWKPE